MQYWYLQRVGTSSLLPLLLIDAASRRRALITSTALDSYTFFFFDALAAPRGWKEPDKLLEMQMHSWQLSNDKFYSEHFLAALLCTLTVVFFPLRSFEETTRAMFSLGALAVQPLLSFSPYCVTKKKKKVNKAWKAAAKPFSVKSSNSLRWRL